LKENDLSVNNAGSKKIMGLHHQEQIAKKVLKQDA
jgi:hypothetical protein